MHAQHDTARCLLDECHADYVVTAIKDNQPTMLDDLRVIDWSVNDGGEVHIFAEVCWAAPTKCMTEHLASRRVKPLRGSFAALRPFG